MLFLKNVNKAETYILKAYIYMQERKKIDISWLKIFYLNSSLKYLFLAI